MTGSDVLFIATDLKVHSNHIFYDSRLPAEFKFQYFMNGSDVLFVATDLKVHSNQIFLIWSTYQVDISKNGIIQLGIYFYWRTQIGKDLAIVL